MLFIQFFGSNRSEIPDALDLHAENHSMMLIGILALSFLLLTFAKYYNAKSILTVLRVFFKNFTIEQELKENMRLLSFSSILLLLNYFISFSLCSFIFFNRLLFVDTNLSIIVSIIIPVCLFLVEATGLFIVGWLTGEQQRFSIPIMNTVTGNQFVGLILSVLALFWIMNPEYNKLFLAIFFGLFCVKYLTRILKNSVVVLSNGVSWYYLILYFCTLEILPLFVAYYYALKNFNI